MYVYFIPNKNYMFPVRNMNIKRRFMAYLNSYVISYYPGMASTSTSVCRKPPQYPKSKKVTFGAFGVQT